MTRISSLTPVLLLALALQLVVPAEVRAQCPIEITANANVTSINVRQSPSDSASTPILRKIQRGSYEQVRNTVSNGVWYEMVNGGYVSVAVAISRCSASIASTNTPMPTRTLQPTPTRIPSPTPGPSPTPRARVWIEFANGTLLDCELPCHFSIYDQLQDREVRR